MPKYGDIVQVKITEGSEVENLYFKCEIDGEYWCSSWEDMVNCLPYPPYNAP